MNEHEALKNWVEKFESMTPVTSEDIHQLVWDGRMALNLAIEEETIQSILEKVDNIAKLVKIDFSKIPKIIDDGEGEIHLEGYDQNNQFVSIRIPRGE